MPDSKMVAHCQNPRDQAILALSTKEKVSACFQRLAQQTPFYLKQRTKLLTHKSYKGERVEREYVI